MVRIDDAPDPELKRRLKLFGDQILEWNFKLKRLALDLPLLAEAGYGKDVMPDIRAQARRVCIRHAGEMEKYVERLADNLKHALPRGKGSDPAKDQNAETTDPYDSALEVSAQAQALVQQVVRFLYPQAHTVTLTDLRSPGLIDALKALRAGFPISRGVPARLVSLHSSPVFRQVTADGRTGVCDGKLRSRVRQHAGDRFSARWAVSARKRAQASDAAPCASRGDFDERHPLGSNRGSRPPYRPGYCPKPLSGPV